MNRSIRCLNVVLVLTVSVFLSKSVFSSPVVTIYEYHQFPPMVVSQSKRVGLSFGFARYLTKKSKGMYRFNVEVVTMQTLQSHLKSGLSAMVIFVNPIWFSDNNMEKYLWTDSVLALRDEIVSKKEKPFSYLDKNSFIGKVIGGIEGYTYPVLDEVVKSGDADRVNAKSDIENLKNLKEGNELDAVIVNEGPLKFYSQILGIEDEVFVSNKPSGEYKVRILLTKDLLPVYQFLAGIIPKFESDDDWIALKDLYLP
ncbi:MAG: hypothetical protein JXR16_14180 [Bermanella sp.]